MAEARTFYNKLELTIKDTRPGITSQSGQIMCYPDMARALGNHVNLVSVARGWRVWHNLGSPTCSAIARKAPMDVTVEEFQDLKAIAAQLDDPRAPINILHPVENIIAISIAAIIAGAEGPKSIARWADEKKDWLATWLPLPQEKKKRPAETACERSSAELIRWLFKPASSTGSTAFCPKMFAVMTCW